MTSPVVPVTTTSTVMVEALKSELDEALSDALRRASSRAEHIRLTRITGLVQALGLSVGAGGSAAG